MAKKLDIQHIRSSTSGKIPLPSDLSAGVLALNTADGKAFTKKDDGTVVEIGVEHGGVLWGAATTYKVGDVVTANDDAYIALLDNSNVNPVGNIVEWKPAGSSCKCLTNWDTTASYKIGDTAINPANGSIYIAETDNQGKDIATSPVNWRILGSSAPTVFVNGTQYYDGDVITALNAAGVLTNYLADGDMGPGDPAPNAVPTFWLDLGPVVYKKLTKIIGGGTWDASVAP